MRGSNATISRAFRSTDAPRHGTAVFLLWGVLWSAAAGSQNAPAETDKDLDLIPQAVQQQPGQTQSPTPAPLNAGSRLYVENAFTLNSLRSQPVVPSPGPRPFNWQERLFLDIRKEWRLADPLIFTYSGRVNFRAEDDLGFPTHENLTNDLREAYLGWQPWSRTYLDLGRINLKSGVALGYNPTDFFRTRAVVEPLSADPTVLREDRLGTFMLRAQQLLGRGSLTLAFAPKLYEPSPIYTEVNLPSADPMLDRTNARNRFLAKASVNIGDRFSPELLLYRESNQMRLGTNLAESFGQKWVAYLEWAGGRHASLIDDALRYGRQTGTLPPDAPSLIPESSHESFQNELAIGASYTTETRITFNLEYHLNQAGFTRTDWRGWFASGYGHERSLPIIGELWYLRDYALDQQYPLSRHSAFLRADWVDAFVPSLELSGFINSDLYDGSGLLQISADYYLSDHWTVGGLAATSFGRARSDFGSLAQAASFMFKVARYF
jgi:hypothetical protein